MKLVSWNVNGVRAAHKKGLLDFMEKARADVICLQEAKCHPGDVQHIAWPYGYEVFWNPAVKKGYSGTVIFTRVKPKGVTLGIGMKGHDDEGRVITAEYPDFYLMNVYQPNSQRGLTRLKYRTEEWDPAFLGYLKKLEKKGKPVVFCGDLNVAHTNSVITWVGTRTNSPPAAWIDGRGAPHAPQPSPARAPRSARRVHVRGTALNPRFPTAPAPAYTQPPITFSALL